MTQQEKIQEKIRKQQDASDYLAYMQIANIRTRRKIEKENIKDPLEIIKICENETRIMRDKYREEIGSNEFTEDDDEIFRYELKNKHHLSDKQIKAIEQEC